MKWILMAGAGVLGAVLLVALVAWLVGRSLPPEHEAIVAREMATQPSVVAAIVRDVAGQPRWRPGVRRIKVVERSAAELRYVEHGPNGEMPFRFREEVPDQRFTSTIDDATLPFGGTWTIELAPDAGGGTRVTITERGIVRPPIFRAVAKHVFGHTRTIQQYLDALAVAVAAPR